MGSIPTSATLNKKTKMNASSKNKQTHWIKREFAIFGGMIVESLKFIIVSAVVFGSVYGIINGPALWNNVRWWWYVNYVGDESGKWWGINFPEVSERAEPNNTLFIKKIGVEAPIVLAQSRDASEVNKLLLQGVVHYEGTAMPGEKGNTFITGHSSYYWWSDGKYNNVFSILDKLVIGDKATIHYDFKRYEYQVEDIRVVSPKDISVLEPDPDRRTLTLMTCTPVGTNYKRLIVKFKQTYPVVDGEKNNKK